MSGRSSESTNSDRSLKKNSMLCFDRTARCNRTDPYEENPIVVLQSKKFKYGGSNAKSGWHTLKNKVSRLSSTSRTC